MSQPVLPRGLLWTLAPMLAALALLIGGERAFGALSPASVIDGPSSAILDVDGAAMAPDGTGGILYRKLVQDQPHLFVARFLNGLWQPPIEVDGGQPFGASFPAVAAGDDGRLLVVWAEPWAVIDQVTHYRLMSAAVEPGAQQFGPALPIDNIGDGTAAYPSLAMAPNGTAYVAYRAVTNSLAGQEGGTVLPLKPGDELVDVRVARYNGAGLPWTLLGAINNHHELTMRHPSATNGPTIGVGLSGNAVVAWQEPDVSGTARIWARRIFGSRLGNVLEVSPSTSNGRPTTAEADAPAIAVGEYGEAKIAYRLEGGYGSPYSSAQILLNILPAETDPKGAKLTGAKAVGGGSTTLGPPSVSIDAKGTMRLSYVGAGAAMTLTGDDFKGKGAPFPLGSATGVEAPTTLNPAGGGITAWKASSAGMEVIDARQEFAGGGSQLAQLAAPLSGPVSEPLLAGSGQGDALIAFRQGPPSQPQVMAAVAKAPPSDFLAFTPIGWVKGGSATVSWESPLEAFGTTTYAVLVDGHVVAQGLSGLSARLSSRGLGDGTHRIQVLATDSLGQQTLTPAADLEVNANPPQVTVQALARNSVRVRIQDHASGAVAGATVIAFGDGAHVNGKLSVRHTYSHSGRYVIVVRARDKVGNKLDAHIRVQIG